MEFYEIAASGKRKNSGGSYTPPSGATFELLLDGDGNDNTGNGNNFSVAGGTNTNGINGASNTAINFLGASGLTSNSTINLSATKKISLCMWIKTVTGSTQILARNSIGVNGIYLYYDGNNSFQLVDYGAGTNISVSFTKPTGTNPHDGNWHSLILTNDRTVTPSCRLYYDNVECSASSSPGSGNNYFSNATWYLYRRQDASYNFTGTGDNCRLYPRILDSTERTLIHSEKTI